MFGADMLGTILRGFGLSPEMVMETAQKLNTGVDRIAQAIEAHGRELTAQRELLNAIALHLGVTVPIDPVQLEVAAEKTAEALTPFGGALPPVMEGTVPAVLYRRGPEGRVQ